MAKDQEVRGWGVAAGEGFDLAGEPAPTSTQQVEAFWCLRFLRAVRDVAFATVGEQGLPAVRIIDVMAVEPGRLFFLAPRGKAFHDDVMRTGFVALVGQTPDLRTCRLRGRVVRPQGDAEQRRLVDMMFALNPSMELLYPGDSRRVIDSFCIEEGEGEYFDLGQKPLLRVPFTFGGSRGSLGLRFLIGEACTGCGRCVRECPDGCIESGVPFRIRQEHCLRCGLCAEVCPEHAVKKVR